MVPAIQYIQISFQDIASIYVQWNLYNTLGQNNSTHVTVVTQALVVCLICPPSALGPRDYVTLPLHTIGFTIFIVVLITFDCGFEL